MASSEPELSPTSIIWVTIGGNTSARASGPAIVSPPLIASIVCMTASSTVLFPDVRAQISSPSIKGTPLERSVLKVRVNFAIETFWISGPTTGNFKEYLSMIILPLFVAYIRFRKKYPPYSVPSM